MELEDLTMSSGEIQALVRRIHRPVVLVGMMGVGKSTVGRKLAQTLHLHFIDADEEIETAAQMSIPEIFDSFGESGFRDGERRVIARLISDSESTPKVIATGGGAFCQDQTRALILDNAITVWLDADIDVLLERVSRKSNRPLLKQGDPRETLCRLRDERMAFYSQAPIHIKSGNFSHTRTVSHILKGIDAWL